ncbi:reverse transcriptase domain-containing protein [Tanacetum coccineum]
MWGIDFMGPFPSSRGNKYILVVVDYLSKWVEAKALPTNDVRVVCKFLKSLFARFGAPRAIISDRGTHFCNDQFAKVMLKYGVTHRLSTAYPQIRWQVECEMWNLKVKGTDVVGYNQQFQELALVCARMFPEESDKIKKYVGGLPDMIHRSVMESKPKTMHDAIEFATELMDKKIRTFAERQRSVKKKPYGGSKPLCSKCNYHHDGQCAPKYHKWNRVGHLARDCRSTANANTANNQRGTEAGQKATCFECGAHRHFKRECPKLKNNNRGNQGGNGNAPAKVYAVSRAGTNPDSNVVTGTFLLNNCYASILFDTGADRSLCLLYLAPKLISHQLP